MAIWLTRFCTRYLVINVQPVKGQCSSGLDGLVLGMWTLTSITCAVCVSREFWLWLAWHQWCRMIDWSKDIVSWKCGGTLYLSVVFSWHLEAAEAMAQEHRGKVVAGGPAVKLNGAPWADEVMDACPFDALSMHNPLATFTTRGCENRCGFCAVPKIEGDFRELPHWKPAPIVCDNNLLCSSNRHFERVIDSLLPFNYVDFNQGLDARRFSPYHAYHFSRLLGCKVRFAFDWIGMESKVADAIWVARAAGLRDFGVYVLIGFNDTPEDAVYRLETVRSWGILPNPMRYQPLDAKKKDGYLHPAWDENTMKRVQRYYSRLVWLGHIPFKDYDVCEESLFQETPNDCAAV